MEEYTELAADVFLGISETYNAIPSNPFFYDAENFRISYSLINSKLMREEINLRMASLNERLIKYNLQLQRCISGSYVCWCDFEIVG